MLEMGDMCIFLKKLQVQAAEEKNVAISASLQLSEMTITPDNQPLSETPSITLTQSDCRSETPSTIKTLKRNEKTINDMR